MITDLWQYLQKSSKPVVLYGMGNGADKIISVLDRYNIKVSGVFASDGFVKNKLFHGMKIESFDSIRSRLGDITVLLCFGSARPEVLENVKRISKLCELYAPDVPVVGDTLFCAEYYHLNEERFQKIRNRLADDISKHTFDSVINYKLSGKPEYLYDCEVPPDEPYNSFLKLSQNECYMDLGGYNGDTALEFARRVNGKYSKIIIAEPDGKTYKKLLKNTEMLKNTECHNVAVSCFSGKAPFGMRSGRGSGVAGGNTETDFVTADCLSGENKITYIKADVEGEELNVINGAEKIIKTQKPKMLISCYHRTEDLFTLPEAVLSLNPDYKLYMRHLRSLPCWDTAYYFI